MAKAFEGKETPEEEALEGHGELPRKMKRKMKRGGKRKATRKMKR